MQKPKAHKKFIALDEPAMKMSTAPSKKERYYPSAHISKEIDGLDKPGETKTVRMRVRVRGVTRGEDGRNSTDLELLGLHVESESV